MALAELAEPLTRQLEALTRARQRSTPLVLARDRSLPVVDALATLLPDGLRRGATVAANSTTLALALAVAASQAGSWTAVVSAPTIGLQAAVELGVAPERLLLVDPPRDHWSTTVAALVDAVDLILLSSPRVAPGDARRLTARARERGAVLLTLPGTPWPGVDVRLGIEHIEWLGPCGGGAGRLTARRADVTSTGRGAAARQRRATLWLPAEDGTIKPA